MEETNNYAKRTKKDYSIQFKIQLVKEIKSVTLELSEARKKHDIQGDSTVRRITVKIAYRQG